MALIEQNQNSRILLGIANGKITHKPKNGEPKLYAAIEGHLVSIGQHTTPIKDIPTDFVDFILEDNGETYDVSVPESSSIARGIILCLASVESFIGNKVKLMPYLSKDGKHTNVTVYVNDQKVSWVTDQIPAVEQKSFGSKVVIDDSKRIAFVREYLAFVRQKLMMAEATPQARADVHDNYEPDMPSDESWMDAEHM